MKRNPFKIILKLFSLIGGFTFILILAVINGSIGFLCSISLTVLASLGIAKLLGVSIALSFPLLFGLIIGAGLLRGLLRYFEQYSNHYIAFKLLAILRNKIFTALRRLCPAKLETKQKGSIISMITSDIETLEIFYAHTLSPISIALFVSLAMTLFIGLVVSWTMALFALFSYTLIGLILPFINGTILAKSGNEYRSDFSFFNGFFMDSIKGSKEIILHNREEEKNEAVNLFSKKLLTSSKTLRERSTLIQGGTEIIMALLNFSMVGLGFFLVSKGVVDSGLVVVGVVALLSSFGPVLAVNALPSNLNQTLASANRIFDLLEDVPVVVDIEDGKNFDFSILQIKNLKFSYNEQMEVLTSVNLTIGVGEIIGIKGESGCGKSTLLKLLLRFWKKGSGEILYNSIDIENINTDSLKHNVAMVSQTTYIFDDTIKNNLKIANPEATDEEITVACKKASIHNHIMAQTDGYNTKIGSSGLKFSAGETQRIGLARAFLSNAKLILLDEPTSNVDSLNETIILNSLRANKEGKAIILVSHRDSTLSIADKIYNFAGGKLYE